MKILTKSLAINTSCIVICTAIINTFLHETAHFIVALGFGVKAELHHNFVHLEGGSELQNAIIAASGPLFSLFFGVICLFISKRMKPSLSKLFLLWLSLGGLLTFLGYFLIAPFAANGDTGLVFHYLKVPIIASISIAIVSFIGMNILFSRLSKQFVYYKSAEIYNKKDSILQLFLFPIISSMIAMVALNLPVITWVSLLPPIFMPFTYLSTIGSYKDLDIINPPFHNNKISPSLIFLLLILIFSFRFLV